MKMKNSQQPQPQSQNVDEKHQQHSNVGESSVQQQQPSPSSINEDKLVKSWNSQDVRSWLEGKGHPQSVVSIFTNEEIDGKCILLLTESDIRNDLGIRILTQLKRVYFDILELQQNQHQYGLLYTNQSFHGGLQFQQSFDQVSSKTSLKQRRRRNQYKQRYKRGVLYDYGSDSVDLTADEIEENLAPSSSSSQRSQEGPVLNNTNSNEINFHHHQHQQHELARAGYATHLEPEIWKALVAMAYVFIVTWITALVMVIVHDRVPDMKKYPPLPDLFLDNMPHIPWAFEMCEVTGTFLFALWFGVLFFHKHRFILIRRFFALSGTVFLLRCVTMLITSLSVPGTHLRDQCNPRPYGDWASRLYNAYLIWKGAGMSIQGVRTCGDYMFSGHTVALTMLNFFVTEYTTRRLYFIHTFSWLLNMFGIFFILAAHEHYSIDVFIAFYITSRLFLYYHTLSNNQALMTIKTKNIQKTKVWFPLFSFFESSVDGIVPNQYEWPITPQRLGFLIREFCRVTENKWKEWLTLPENGFLMMKSKAFLLKPTAGRVFSATSSRMRMFKRNSRAEAD